MTRGLVLPLTISAFAALLVAGEVLAHRRPIEATQVSKGQVSKGQQEASLIKMWSGPADGLVRIVLARPLFNPSRRPVAGRSIAPELPRLTGIITQAGGNSLAIFSVAGEATALVMREGDSRHGVRIEAIRQGGVIAMIAGRRLRLVPASANNPVEVENPKPVFVMTKDPRSREAGNQDE